MWLRLTSTVCGTQRKLRLYRGTAGLDAAPQVGAGGPIQGRGRGTITALASRTTARFLVVERRDPAYPDVGTCATALCSRSVNGLCATTATTALQ